MTVRLTEPSLRTHGVLSEPSLRTHCGKGSGREVEGKWKGSGREVEALLTTRVETSHHGVQEGDVAGPPDEMMPFRMVGGDLMMPLRARALA